MTREQIEKILQELQRVSALRDELVIRRRRLITEALWEGASGSEIARAAGTSPAYISRLKKEQTA